MGNKINEQFWYNKKCFYSAIEGGNLEWIKMILDRTPNFVNESIDDGQQISPLQRSVWRNDMKTVEFLLQNGADVNLQLNEGHSALMWAAKRNHQQMFKYLVEQHNADLQLINKQQSNFNVLDYSIQFGNYSIAFYICNKSEIIPKSVQEYTDFRIKHKLIWIDYQVIIESLKNKIKPELVPTFNVKPKEEKVFIDPVIDPRESWGQYVTRIVEFQDPPICERNELPQNLQPQNSLIGKVRQIINGQPVYSSQTSLKKTQFVTQEDQEQLNIFNQNIENPQQIQMQVKKL